MDNVYEPQVAVITPSQVHCACCCSREPGKFNHPTLLIVIAVKLWLATSGLYLWVFIVFLHVAQSQPSVSSWEFFTTLDYEWGVIRGRLPYRWTIWVSNNRCFSLLFTTLCVWADLFIRQIYSLARVAALLGVTLGIVIMNITTPINCQVGTVFYVYSLGL
jgi:hypothetical protein